MGDDGLLDDATKQPLPELPATVGIATSSESDAREDAVTSIHEACPDVDIVVHDTTVQGESTMLSLMDSAVQATC